MACNWVDLDMKFVTESGWGPRAYRGLYYAGCDEPVVNRGLCDDHLKVWNRLEHERNDPDTFVPPGRLS